MKKLLSLLTVLAMSTACTNAVDDAVAAYAKGDFETAVKILRPLAEQGRASAQFNLGQMYRQGYGVAQDYTVAIMWFKLAAKQGHDIAQYNLGVMYEDGIGVPRNHGEAVKWFKLAADQGLTPAKAKLISWKPEVVTSLPSDKNAEVIPEHAAASSPVREDISAITEPIAAEINPAAEETSAPPKLTASMSNSVQEETSLLPKSDEKVGSSETNPLKE